jgi:hypothetical protein
VQYLSRQREHRFISFIFTVDWFKPINMGFILLVLFMVLSGYTFTANVAGKLLNTKAVSISSNDLLYSLLNCSCFP